MSLKQCYTSGKDTKNPNSSPNLFTETDYWTGEEGSDLKILTDSDLFKKKLLPTLAKATHSFFTLGNACLLTGKESSTASSFLGEKEYKELYDSMMEYDHEYFSCFLLAPENSIWLEQMSGVIGTLATIYRQRGLYEECRIVHQGLHKKLLNAYTTKVEEMKVSSNPSQYSFTSGGTKDDIDRQIACHKELLYKAARIAVNLYPSLNDSTFFVGPYYRRVIQHEIDNGIDYENSEFGWMMPTFLGRQRTSYSLANTTDEELQLLAHKVALFAQSQNQEVLLREITPEATLNKCAGCGVTEEFIGTLLVCSGCSSARYCAPPRNCQRQHWKKHKESCKKAQATKKKKQEKRSK